MSYFLLLLECGLLTVSNIQGSNCELNGLKAYLYAREGRYEKILSLSNDSCYQTSVFGQLAIGRLYESRKDWDTAAQIYTTLLQSDSTPYKNWISYELVRYMIQFDSHDEIEYVEKLYEVYPNFQPVVVWYFSLNPQSYDPAEMLSRLVPTYQQEECVNPDISYLISDAYLNLGSREHALRWINRAIADAINEEADYIITKANIKSLLYLNQEEAILLYRQAIEIEPFSVVGYSSLLEYLYLSEDKSEGYKECYNDFKGIFEHLDGSDPVFVLIFHAILNNENIEFIDEFNLKDHLTPLELEDVKVLFNSWKNCYEVHPSQNCILQTSLGLDLLEYLREIVVI